MANHDSVMSETFSQPDFVIHSQAPLRICDLGGWTDTWFAGSGRLLNIAIEPLACVQIAVQHAPAQPYIRINAENFNQQYEYRPGQGWSRQPLIEAAIDRAALPTNLGLEIAVHCPVPPGASTGTSAAVAVALLGALDGLTPGRLAPPAVAQAAWAVETEMLGLQSGIQDQLAAAIGGINYIQMDRYPQAEVTALQLPEETCLELERRLVLVYLGSAHSSSRVHEQVIQRMENSGPQAEELQALRQMAPAGRQALQQGDLEAFGEVLIANHEAQRRLHPDLINAEADAVAALARTFGVIGWKTNGAGGPGGSLTLLCGPRADQQRALLRALSQMNNRVQPIPIRLARRGLQAWQTS